MVRRTTSTRLFFLSLLAAPFALAVDSDFSGLYPDAAIPCLDEASEKSNCNGASDGKALNECLCSNTGDFVVNSAKCLGKKAKNQVKPVYQVMSDACLQTETPLTISQSEWTALADGDQDGVSTSSSSSSETSTSASSTASEEPTNTGDNNDDKNDSSEEGGLSTAAIAGIGAGAGVLAIAGVLGLLAWYLRRRRRAGEESHPMLPTDNSSNPYHGAATTFPPTEPSPGLSPGFDKDQKQGRWSAVSGLTASHNSEGYSPAMTHHTVSPPPTGGVVSSWGSPPPGWSNGQYAGAYATPPVVAELPPEPAAGAQPVFEMDGGQQPAAQGQGQYTAELPGTGGYQSYDPNRR
ncbi:hypothetical protein LIA77_06716 [Sarocladium implicatum]|nr:hypothetical protein LIA77_06716 [Sarocladium implicatum]